MYLKKQFIKKSMIGSLVCLLAFSGAVFADDQTENEISVQELPKDGILYFSIDQEDKGALQIFDENKKTYVQLSGEEETEKIELTFLEIPDTYFAITALYMRELPDTESKEVQILKIEQPITVYAIAEEWYLAGTEKGYGFVAKKYLTDSAEEASQAAKTEAAVRAAQQAASQAAIAQQASSSTQNRYEVSRESVPNCADGSHGTTYITYSDGSVEAVGY